MNSVASEPALIGVDWGTSSLRAYLIGTQGEILDRVSSPEGIMRVRGQTYERILDRLIGRWAGKSNLPILASGMITSRNGWIETSYAELPLGACSLAKSLVPYKAANGAYIYFVTGATTETAQGPDVMRGEETQIVGAFAFDLSEGCFVLPGTHCKWVQVVNRNIVHFATYITGEIFATLKAHTILGSLMTEDAFSETTFVMGVKAGLDGASNLLHNLFHVRTLPLMGKISQEDTADYMSGLLIGSEVAAAVNEADDIGTITIVGESDLSDRYEIALRIAGIASRRAPNDVVAKGHFLIACEAGLLG